MILSKLTLLDRPLSYFDTRTIYMKRNFSHLFYLFHHKHIFLFAMNSMWSVLNETFLLCIFS